MLKTPDFQEIRYLLDALSPQRRAQLSKSIGNVLFNGQMWKQRVILKEVADLALLRGQEDVAFGVKPDFVEEPDDTAVRPFKSR